MDVSDPDKSYAANYAADKAAVPPAGAPSAEPEGEEAEGFGMSDVLLDSVTKDEWKSIEASLSHHKKTVAEMLKRACAQVRTKGELQLDESNGKFLGDMLPEMDTFAVWCYKVGARARARPLRWADAQASPLAEPGLHLSPDAFRSLCPCA